jgi:pimeloyl-ACP methyl ester carboxylesterase
VDRDRYPHETHPYGQFDYMAFYQQDPERATAVFDAHPGRTVKALFRRGAPQAHRRRAPTSEIVRNGGWFGGGPSAPEMPLDTAVLGTADHQALTDALTRNGFSGPTGYYLNHEANARYAAAAPDRGILRMPVLFIGAEYDLVADLRSPRTLAAMRGGCTRLTEAAVPAGHWLQMERSAQVNRLLEQWLQTHVGFSAQVP